MLFRRALGSMMLIFGALYCQVDSQYNSGALTPCNNACDDMYFNCIVSAQTQTCDEELTFCIQKCRDIPNIYSKLFV